MTRKSLKKSLFFSEVDIIIGAADQNIQTKDFVNSHSYYHDALTWCVQKQQPIPIWRNIFFICNDPFVLSLYPVMCISVFAFAYFIQQFEEKPPKLNLFIIMLEAATSAFGLSCNYKAKLISNRIFFACCMFGNLVFVNNVLSFIIRNMTSTIYEHQIETIQEIIENSFELTGDDFTFKHLIQQNEVILLENLLKNVVIFKLNITIFVDIFIESAGAFQKLHEFR